MAEYGFKSDTHMAVCQAIEQVLLSHYRLQDELSDPQSVFALDKTKIALKKQFGFAKNEVLAPHELTQNLVDDLLEMGLIIIEQDKTMPLKEFIDLLDKVKKSVQRHSNYGSRGYFLFIQQHLLSS